MKLNKKTTDFINLKGGKNFPPFYLYNSDVIEKQCRHFQNLSYKNKAIHFATMANINADFLRIVKNEGINVFVNSISHLKKTIDAGFEKNQIIFTASALSEETMRFINETGVQTNLDSPLQLALWQKRFPGKPTGIRCNIGDIVAPFSNHAGAFIGKESRLGFTIDEMMQIKDKHIIKGLHLYVGTDIFDIDYFINCYNELIKLANNFPEIEYLNFGGGFGVSEKGDKTFDFETYNTRLTHLMENFSERQGKSIKLILEPGRIIGGEAGYFVTCVTDVKKRGDKYLVGLNASTVQFSRPLLYPDIANHPVAVLRDGKQVSEDENCETTIYGCSTYSRDLFSKKIKLPEIFIGDIIVFGNAGSYAASSHSSFLGFEKPEEFFI